MIRHKFNAKPTTVNDIKFSSKKEAKYYSELLLRQKDGEVLFFLRQVPFHRPGNVRYVCDFQVFLASGEVQFIDVKGMKVEPYPTKKKIIEAIFPIEIIEV